MKTTILLMICIASLSTSAFATNDDLVLRLQTVAEDLKMNPSARALAEEIEEILASNALVRISEVSQEEKDLVLRKLEDQSEEGLSSLRTWAVSAFLDSIKADLTWSLVGVYHSILFLQTDHTLTLSSEDIDPELEFESERTKKFLEACRQGVEAGKLNERYFAHAIRQLNDDPSLQPRAIRPLALACEVDRPVYIKDDPPAFREKSPIQVRRSSSQRSQLKDSFNRSPRSSPRNSPRLTSLNSLPGIPEGTNLNLSQKEVQE